VAGAHVGGVFGVGGVADLVDGFDRPLAAYEGGRFGRGGVVGGQAGQSRDRDRGDALACSRVADLAFDQEDLGGVREAQGLGRGAYLDGAQFASAVSEGFVGVRAETRRLDDGSRVSREVPARFCERRRVRFPPPTLRVIHCRTLERAQQVLAAVVARMAEVGLEVHPDKTKIVYCGRGRGGDGGPGSGWPHVSFTFLGYTFRARKAVGRDGRYFTNFLPAISDQALKRLSAVVRGWDLHRRTGYSRQMLARMINPVLAGWMAYYGKFYRSQLYPLFYRVDTYLLRWIKKKYRVGTREAERRLVQGFTLWPTLYKHWKWTPPAGAAHRATRAV